MAFRPKRSTRSTQKAAPPPVASSSKSKLKEIDLQHLCQNPKSPLTKMDIADVICAESWIELSPESHAILSTLLPPTAFQEYKPYLDPSHPKADKSSQPSSSGVVDLGVFKDAHFIAATHTFQDHIFSGWRTNAQVEKVHNYVTGIREGTMCAAHKDEVWEKENTQEDGKSAALVMKLGGVSMSVSTARAGQAAELSLGDLVSASVLKVGDVLSYRRQFLNLGVLVEKDVIIQSVNDRTHAITVLFPTGTTQYLPTELLAKDPGVPDDAIRTTTFTSPTMLETVILDTDGRVEKGKRPNGNAWKCFTVWRWRDDDTSPSADERSGRESHGTIFYIRGCFYHDR